MTADRDGTWDGTISFQVWRPGSILLSKASWHLVSDTIPCQLRGEVEVEGVRFLIAMYEPETDLADPAPTPA